MSNPELHRIQQAEQAMAEGRFDDAVMLAVRVCAEGQFAQAPELEARARLSAAQALRLVGRFEVSHEHALRAVHLFRRAGDRRQEIASLSLLSHAACNIGRLEESIDAACLAVALAEGLPPLPERVGAYNYLGVACLWSQQWDEAHAALEAAVNAAAQCSPPVSPLQPWLNRLMTETYRAVLARCAGNDAEARTRALGLGPVIEALGHRQRWQDMPVFAGQIGEVQWLTARCIHDAWSGQLEAAQHSLEQGEAWLQARNKPPSSHDRALLAMARINLLWTRGEFSAALAINERQLQQDQQLGHGQLLGLGWLVNSRLLELLGQPDRALQALHALRRHESRLRASTVRHGRLRARWAVEQRALSTGAGS